MVKDASDN